MAAGWQTERDIEANMNITERRRAGGADAIELFQRYGGGREPFRIWDWGNKKGS